MFNDPASPFSLLATRRSGRPRELVAPGPSAEELRRILQIAIRTPDHGKLAPWRFIHVPADRRGELASLLQAALKAVNPDPARLEIEAAERFAHQAPELVVVLFSPRNGVKIPLWEQELSCGAACMNLLAAAAALGYCGGWITGWPAYSDTVRDAFGTSDEKIAGFFFIGTPGAPLEERPRPTYDQAVSEWSGSLNGG